MPFLIDGYNLLHAIGLLHGRTGPHSLAKARAALLGLLTAAHRDPADEVTVVFDAHHTRAETDDAEQHGAVRVEFAHREEADDRIEWLITHAAVPKRLIVVSDDHRLQRAARRRNCIAWKCADYLDWLERRHRERPRVQPPEPSKPGAVSPAETERWLAAFGELQDEPAFRELFDTFDDNSETSPKR